MIGDWRLEIGDWRLEIEDWRLEIGDWRLEIGDWRLEIGDLGSSRGGAPNSDYRLQCQGRSRCQYVWIEEIKEDNECRLLDTWSILDPLGILCVDHSL